MDFVKYALTTEKAVAGIERNNSIVFIVDLKSTKADIKAEVERKYETKVASVNTLVTAHGLKKAIVKFIKAGQAADLASKLKII
ncbi:50S ribosomal protein L23 [Candidatus Micrarchaeota archaeon CG1_02_55_22]|nr:MAG: 50S ribosomal protein L23 [Candidatus Micrarchaeota archaeon CG1_02_55_22]